MAIFGFGKKQEEKKTEKVCGCSCGCSSAVRPSEASSSIKVLGSGCAKCNALEQSVLEALAELGMEQTVDHVTDFTEIAAYGVMSTPALVVDGKVVSMGKVLSRDEAAEAIRRVRG